MNFSNTTTFDQMEDFDRNVLLSEVMLHGYHLKGRRVPEDINDLVDSLRFMVLKYMPKATAGAIRESVERYILNEETPGLSVAVFFKAIRSGYTPSRQERSFDNEQPARKDTEMDTIALLDVLMDKVARGARAYANWPREYSYLVMRGQLSADAFAKRIDKAKSVINAMRSKEHMRPVEVWEDGAVAPTLNAMARQLCVTDWLLSCSKAGTTPSEILSPMINSVQYDEWREAQ